MPTKELALPVVVFLTLHLPWRCRHHHPDRQYILRGTSLSEATTHETDVGHCSGATLQFYLFRPIIKGSHLFHPSIARRTVYNFRVDRRPGWNCQRKKSGRGTMPTNGKPNRLVCWLCTHLVHIDAKTWRCYMDNKSQFLIKRGYIVNHRKNYTNM